MRYLNSQIIHIENIKVVAKGCRKRKEELVFNGYRVSLLQKFQSDLLLHSVNILNTIELHTFKWLKCHGRGTAGLKPSELYLCAGTFGVSVE